MWIWAQATATVGGSEGVHGTVTFSQAVVGGVVTVKGHIKGLDADAKRGFHVQCVLLTLIRQHLLTHTSSELGNLSGGCASAGAHYNPLGVAHGARSDTVRHAGDLGNIQADADGVADFEFEDAVLSLNGVFSIVGRTVMVHSVRRNERHQRGGAWG
jgi:Cu-Zn family superoxide dismutase